MEYPIWHLTTFGGGFWIAFIATIHVFVAQFAVGGGLFLVISEQMAYRTGSEELLGYVKKHSKFFLLLTMVFGGVSGVALWFSMALLSPQGALVLVTEFVFAWATEWVWFVGEIVALLIYFYSWHKMNRSDHVKIGWFYFIFAWLSLFTINGVVGFMLTPGDWLQTHNFWDGIFNPTFWPQLAFRSFLSVMLAGLFGFVTASWLKNPVVRCKMVRLCSLWTLLGLIITLPCGYWYLMALPPQQASMIIEKSHRVAYFMKIFEITAPIVLIGGLIMAICAPRKVKFPSALILLLIALIFYGSFEFIREAGRKPYVLWGVVYSNSVMVDQAVAMEGKSLLQNAKWVPDGLRKVTSKNKLKAGEWLYQMECISCHAINGPMNDIVPRTAKYNAAGLDAFLSGMGRLSKYMSPFLGDEAERMALAEYIDSLSPRAKVVLSDIRESDVKPAPFKSDQKYTLLAWPVEGLRLVLENKGRVALSESGSKVRAQLILRGDPPEVVTDDVKIVCELKAINQPYDMTAEGGFFESPPINALPYSNDGYQPLPLVEVNAVNSAGEIFATTTIVLPVSTRATCNNCHGGDWAVKNQGGLSTRTADDFLKIHDRDNHTDFMERVKSVNGDTIDCASCHDGDSQLDLSAALHGFHAVYLSGKDNEACTMCHPLESLRGHHRTVGMECVNCHGVMENHALALLKADEDKPAAKELMVLLTPVDMDKEEVNSRKPWIQEPDCLTCHADFAEPDTDSAFNVWNEDKSGLFRNRKDEMDAVMCAACHNAPHAIFPAEDERDNLRALQYMGEAKPLGSGGTCTVCHENDMEYAAHHPGMGLE
ncbi:cytochrome ubiquinol oxidase subunit I [Desulfovibrio sp. UCD-KL4C]|uniref:multiheme c-type cytochrome n=1 Tax=Desulfovibrio sp. UCD-KL4C TaxID=2578120 RepID=UPI0025C0E6EB|nr:cytochrome ubiquinol oxidase subunit I [Desulfovibrio sp. UCD-KL4C]